MNKVELMGRLTRDPDIRYYDTQEGTQNCVARYTLAVDRRMARRDQEGQQTADFISCIAFGRAGEFAEKYLQQGTKIAITGRLQTGSYTNKDGQKVYTTDVVIEEQEFAESKGGQEQGAVPQNGQQAQHQGAGQPRRASQGTSQQAPQQNSRARPNQGQQSGGYGQNYAGGFMDIPPGFDDLPFR